MSIDPELAEQIMADGLAIRRLEAWRLENPTIRWWKIAGPDPLAPDECQVDLHKYSSEKPVSGYSNTLSDTVAAALKAWEDNP